MKVSYKDWNIGPAHDPYGATLFTAEVGDHQVGFYQDGLGRCRFTMCEGPRNARPTRVIEWHTADPERTTRQLWLKCSLLARRWVGHDLIDIENQAINEAAEMADDPMSRHHGFNV